MAGRKNAKAERSYHERNQLMKKSKSSEEFREINRPEMTCTLLFMHVSIGELDLQSVDV